jgi:hypothetical protein
MYCRLFERFFCRLFEHRFKLIRHVTPLLGKVEVP